MRVVRSHALAAPPLCHGACGDRFVDVLRRSFSVRSAAKSE